MDRYILPTITDEELDEILSHREHLSTRQDSIQLTDYVIEELRTEIPELLGFVQGVAERIADTQDREDTYHIARSAMVDLICVMAYAQWRELQEPKE